MTIIEDMRLFTLFKTKITEERKIHLLKRERMMFICIERIYDDVFTTLIIMSILQIAFQV